MSFLRLWKAAAQFTFKNKEDQFMGYSTDEKCAILKICSLFMIVDGTCYESEQALLNKVYKEMNVNDSVKKEVLDYCVSIAAAMERGDNSAQVISEIDKIDDEKVKYEWFDIQKYVLEN